jgi:hypothetical protein
MGELKRYRVTLKCLEGEISAKDASFRLCPIIPVKTDDLVYNIKCNNFKKIYKEATQWKGYNQVRGYARN